MDWNTSVLNFTEDEYAEYDEWIEEWSLGWYRRTRCTHYELLGH